MKSYFLMSILLITGSVHALTLDEYLAQVKSRHKGVEALEKSKEAASFRREAGDLAELSTAFQASVLKLDDQKPQPATGFLVDRTQATQYSLGLGKQFSTGTKAAINATAADNSVQLRNSPEMNFGTASLGISLSQSLLKNGFGSATSFRREREQVIEQTERQSFDLQLQQLFISAEAAFWDRLYLQKELEIRKESLERARRIESWVRRRVGNGIGNNTDLYNAQGLVAARELLLLTAEDELLASEAKIRETLDLAATEKIPVLTGDLSSDRKLAQMSQGGAAGRKVRLDTYLSVLEAKTRSIVSQETADRLRPDLVVEGTYNTNAYDPEFAKATGNISDASRPTSTVAVRFTYLLDSGLKNSARQAARADALAASLKKDRSLLESQTAWTEINRRHGEMSKKVRAASLLSEVQTKKAAAERDMLSKGRSITSQVITAEQDAAEAQLNLSKLRAEQRKLESQARMFVSMEE